MPRDEKVLVIPRAHLDEVGFFRGFRPADDAYTTALLNPAQYSFRPRSTVETDPAYLQLIPYVVLKHQGDLFHYRRGSSGSEARLRALRSVGIGGHISEDDAAGGDDLFRTGLNREVHEEVQGVEGVAEIPLGLIYDDSTPVGQVHLGVALVWEIEHARVTPREDCLADAGFESLLTLKANRDAFETWSQLVLDHLIVQG